MVIVAVVAMSLLEHTILLAIAFIKEPKKCTINSIPCEVTLLNGNNIDEIKLKNFMPQKPDIEIVIKLLSINTFIIPQQTQPSWGFSLKSLPNTSGHMSKVANDTFINIPYEISYPNGQTTICVLDLKKQ
jgi:hypothetical protein